MQPPKLCDTEAFDTLPAEELSDDETDDHPPILLISEEFSYSTDNKSRWTYRLEVRSIPNPRRNNVLRSRNHNYIAPSGVDRPRFDFTVARP
jgi:hypothetical protein